MPFDELDKDIQSRNRYRSHDAERFHYVPQPLCGPDSQPSSQAGFLISLLSVMICVEFHINGFYTMYLPVSDFFHLVSFFSGHPVLVYFSTSVFLLLSRRRRWHPTPVLLPGKSHGRRSLVGCSPWGCYESGTTERLHFHFSVSCIGEGNGNPLQCSCLENLRDRGARWAAVWWVAQSRTQLKRLSSSSSSSRLWYRYTTIYLFTSW